MCHAENREEIYREAGVLSKDTGYNTVYTTC